MLKYKLLLCICFNTNVSHLLHTLVNTCSERGSEWEMKIIKELHKYSLHYEQNHKTDRLLVI